MATIGAGKMDIEYTEGENLEDVMRITEKENIPNEELMKFFDSSGNVITIEQACESLNIREETFKKINYEEVNSALKEIDNILNTDLEEESFFDYNYSDIIGPEEKKFFEWLKEEKENGLTTYKFILPIEDFSFKDNSLNISYSNINCSREDFFKQLNSANYQLASGIAVPFVDDTEEYF